MAKGKRLLVMRIAVLLLILLFAVAYAVAVGPYWKITPDSAAYVLGAKSLAAGEGYAAWGRSIPLFPPLTSLVFSLLLRLFPDTYLLLNGLVTAAVLASLFLFWKLMRSLPETAPGLLIVLLSLGSVPLFRESTFLLSDIFFMFFSAGSLLFLEKIVGGRSSLWAVPASGFLLAACMTRSAGIAMLVSVFGFIVLSLSGRRDGEEFGSRKTRLLLLALVLVLPLLFTIFWGVRNSRLGLSYFDLFFQKVAYVPEAGTVSLLDLFGRFFSHMKRFLGIGDLLSNAPSLGFQTAATAGRFLGTGLFFWGLCCSLRKKATITALYALFYLLLVEMNQAETGFRLLVPLIPLLFYYAWRGLADIGSRLRIRPSRPAGKTAVVCLAAYFVFHLGLGMRDMLRSIPGEHRSPFGSYPLKYEANYDAQKMALWLRENSPPETIVLSQHARMWSVVTGRRGLDFPFSRDPGKLLALLDRQDIAYVLVDKNKPMVRAYLIPVLQAHPEKFELVIEEERASLYRVEKHFPLFIP